MNIFHRRWGHLMSRGCAWEMLPEHLMKPSWVIDSLSDKAIISVVNVEEDRIAKMHENYIKTDTTTVYKSPPVYLNLYILFAINRVDYKESLQWLGHVIQYFQHQNVFTPSSHPALGETSITKLMVDLHTLSFEQSNQLWSTLGGKYIPSVLYKVRQLTIDENLKQSESVFIKEIEIKDKMKLPLS